MQVINVNSALRDYPVYFVDSPTAYLDRFNALKNAFFVIDDNVAGLYGAKIFSGLDPAKILRFPVSEERKTFDGVMEVYDALLAHAAKRNMTLASIGGGIVQDVTGFAASTLYRGINWIFLPTTLLAQADSCIGSKTSLNYKAYKNLVGTFYPPSEIYIDPTFLHTLTHEDYFSGLGEVIKLHLMGGHRTVAAFEKCVDAVRRRSDTEILAAIQQSLQVKLSFIADDEFDMGKRHLLNFGHCYGHALEAASHFAIPHGQAVLIGILFANVIARRRGLLNQKTFQQLNEEIILPNIVSSVSSAYIEPARIEGAMKMDKKRVGDGLVMVMLLDDYKMTKATDVQSSEIERASEELVKLLKVA